MNEDSGHNLRDDILSQEDAKIMERYERKLIEEFLDFFLGKREGNEKEWTLFKILGVSREKLIEDFFNSRK